MLAWRITKKKYAPYDGSSALNYGGRWNSPGRSVIYASDSFAGAILEKLAHALRPRTLPGPHHAVQIDIPDVLVERLKARELAGWDSKDSPEAIDFGDGWLAASRSAVLVVPALPSRPIGNSVLINPEHRDAFGIRVSAVFDVPWDDRLF